MVPRPEPAPPQGGTRPHDEEHASLTGKPRAAAADTVAWATVRTSDGHRVAQGVG